MRFKRGNAAAMREALRYIIKQIDKNPEMLSAGQLLCIIGDKAESALSAPPRNCDRPECATLKAAQDVWRKEDGGKTPYYEWLFAPAAEQKGE